MVNGENEFAMILEVEGGIDKLEELQMHPNHQIYERALGILEKYFQEDEELDIFGTNTQTSANQTPGQSSLFSIWHIVKID